MCGRRVRVGWSAPQEQNARVGKQPSREPRRAPPQPGDVHLHHIARAREPSARDAVLDDGGGGEVYGDFMARAHVPFIPGQVRGGHLDGEGAFYAPLGDNVVGEGKATRLFFGEAEGGPLETLKITLAQRGDLSLIHI